MKVYVYCDGAYPVYGIDYDSPHLVNEMVEVPNELVGRYEGAREMWFEVQAALEKYYGG